jgi:AraC family transcriptional regulator
VSSIVHTPDPVGGRNAFAVGVAIEPLASTEIFRIGRWRCVVGASESTSLQTQRWPMMSFTHGGAFVVHSGGRSAVIDSSCTLLINADSPYRMSKHFGEASRGAYVMVRPDVFADVARSRGPSGGFGEVEGPSSTRTYLLHRAILERLGQAPPPDALEIDEMAVGLVESAFRHVSPPRETRARRRQNAVVESVRSLILERLSDALKLDDIASAVGLSPFHLCRVFRRVTGRTLHQYRTTLRLRSAYDRISRGNVDLGQLGIELGYSSHSHFTAAFRKEFGVSPSRVRRAAHPGGGGAFYPGSDRPLARSPSIEN